MGMIIATCGHQLSEEEGIGEPFWLYDGGVLSWLVFCRACKARLTPVYVFDVDVLMQKEEVNA